MNNYYDYDFNNYNYSNNNVNNNIDPYKGFIRGNIFDNLYDPYKNYKPYEINPNNEKDYMMLLLQIYDFNLVDLNLYLDIYLNDTNMLNLRDKYLKEYESAKKNYETKYGAITTYSETLNKTPWNWDSSFPWEVNK